MSLINISEGTSLALHGLALIARKAPLRLTVKSLAEELTASQAHLAKVFQKLSKAGIVNSVRGPAGGVELNKPAEEISFLDVYEILEGRIIKADCPLGKISCVFETCIFNTELKRISSDIYKTFRHIRLSNFK